MWQRNENAGAITSVLLTATGTDAALWQLGHLPDRLGVAWCTSDEAAF
jgi:hypothetical protein